MFTETFAADSTGLHEASPGPPHVEADRAHCTLHMCSSCDTFVGTHHCSCLQSHRPVASLLRPSPAPSASGARLARSTWNPPSPFQTTTVDWEGPSPSARLRVVDDQARSIREWLIDQGP